MARAAAGAPGPVRPRPPRAAGSAVISWPPRMPMGTGPGGAGTVPCWPSRLHGTRGGPGRLRPASGSRGPGKGCSSGSYRSRSRSGLGAVRAGAVCRGCPGGGGAGRAVQGGDDRGRRRGGFEAGGEHRAGPVAAPAVDAGQGDGGADHDGGAQSDQRPGRQPYPGLGDVRAWARPPGGRGAARRVRAAGRAGCALVGGRGAGPAARRAGSGRCAGVRACGGDQQVPSGVDPGGVGEGAPAGLRPAAVEVVDLVPAFPAAEVGAGQVPQVVAGHDGVHAVRGRAGPDVPAARAASSQMIPGRSAVCPAGVRLAARAGGGRRPWRCRSAPHAGGGRPGRPSWAGAAR